MLLNFKVANFTTFKDPLHFSMKPGKVMPRFEDNIIVVNPKFKVSKVAVIVGENAGGKTQFMTSLHFLKYLIEEKGDVRSIKKLCYNYNHEVPQDFELTILIAEKIYTYNLSMDKISILSEHLQVRNCTQKESSNKTIFRFQRKEINGPILVNERFVAKELQEIIEKTTHNPSRLCISYMETLDINIIKPFTKWIREKLIIELPSEFSLDIYKQMQNDEKDLAIIKSNEFFEIFSLVDSSIVKFEVDEKDPFRETMIIRKRRDGTKLSIQLKNDSSGVKEFFAWAIQIWKVIYSDATLFADELDRVLNSILASKVLSFVKGSDHQGQFVFSTHNVLHINTIDFMKEQIYFINKNTETLTSEIYSLADFKDYRYEKANVYELYLKGLLGGVPND
ncbi:ATP-binding protein [Lutibacter sp. B2]|nr:ATP-binding protein [Lutibacter sp. B2]